MKSVDLVKVIVGEACVLKSLLPSDDTISEAVVEPLIILRVYIAGRGEAPYLSGNAGRELRRVETIDQRDPALAGEELLIVHIHVIAEDGRDPHSRDDHPLLWIHLPHRQRRGTHDKPAGVGAPWDGNGCHPGR